MSRYRPLPVLTLMCGLSVLLLAAAEGKQKAQVSSTERKDFPPNGTLRFTNSIGVLTVEAWERPEVEITAIKSTKAEYEARDREKAANMLAKVHVAAERRGDELVITTNFPRQRVLRRLAEEGAFSLEYRIKAPSTARLIANHHVGDVNVDGLAGDIQAALLEGQIFLHLPEDGLYDIDAKSAFGHVNSDFPGPQTRRWWFLGHRSVNDGLPAAHKLNLRVGYGDIVIFKTRVPKTPAPLPHPQEPAGI
jgi:hypothetical protein